MLEYILSFFLNPFTIRNTTSKCAEDEVAQNIHIVIGSVPVLYLIISSNWEGGVGQHGDFEYCAVQYLENIWKYTDLYCALLCPDGWWWIDVDCKLHSHLSRTWSKEQYISHSLRCRCIISVLRHVHFHHCAWETHQRYNTWSALSFIVPLIVTYYVSHLNCETICSQRYPFQWVQETKQQQQRAGIQTICT